MSSPDGYPKLFLIVARCEMAEQINQMRLQLEILLLRRLRSGLSPNLSLTKALTLAQGFRLRVRLFCFDLSPNENEQILAPNVGYPGPATGFSRDERIPFWRRKTPR